MKIGSVKGMKDYYPSDWNEVTYVRDTWLSLGKAFGYREFEGPMLEPVELYLGKTSKELIDEQTFSTTDKNGNKLVIRPELTPTLARMVAQREFEIKPPLKWQSFGRFFRYEKPQKGRTRAFFQWNIDLIGIDSIYADIEMLEMAAESMRRLDLGPADVTIRVNNRKILQKTLINRLQIESAIIPDIIRIIDKMDKTERSAAVESMSKIGLNNQQVDRLLAMLENRQEIYDSWFDDLLRIADSIGISEFISIDSQIVRGFDYYTGIVFECWAKAGLSRALFGGGRYDHLTRTVGGRYI